ncbi:PQQ-binding-like beta-propeller repeat protein [Cryptosporangium sp. NPDC051539]|uniref:outer membrane protein assembly factor BamB family protein n=1 Tax=Cryptosporangium sp. NPDC051539 TaxID=3363962 RepID=UPI0037B8D792
MTPLQPGDPERIGSYRLLARLGAGGMGVVYLGWSSGGRAVAVKVVRAQFASDPEFRARFRREVAAARTVSGAFTAPVLDADASADSPWLVTAFLPGVSLREAVEGGGALPAAALPVLAAGLAEALADIHRARLVHRDLKPDNVMLTPDGPRAIDFGIARPEDGTTITEVGMIIGTPAFMSPEQIAGGVTGPASDVFSFGAVLSYAATGALPFGSGGTVATLYRVLDVETDLSGISSPRLREVVAACLRREAADRPSAEEVLDLLSPEQTADAHWLPEPLLRAIEARVAQAQTWTGDADTVTFDPGAAPPTERGVRFTAPPTGPRPPASPRPPAAGSPGVRGTVLSRRALLLGGGVLTAGAAAFAGQRFLGRARRRPDPAAGPRPSPVTPASAAPPPKGVVRWTTKVADYFPEALYTVGDVVLAKTQDDQLIALDAATGRRRWKHTVTGTGTVAGGVVFEDQSANPALARIDARTGARRWSYREDIFEATSGQVAVGGSVVVYGWERLRALDLATGRSRWAAGVNGERGLVTDGPMLVAAGETRLTGLDLRTGTVRWRHPIDYPLYVSAARGLVFTVDSRRVLHAITIRTGATAWLKPAFAGTCAPVPHGDVVYAAGGRGEVFAFRVATGEILWSRFLDQDSFLELADGTLYAAGTGNAVYALDASDGTLLWTYAAQVSAQPGVFLPGMTAGNGQLVVGLKSGDVRALAGSRRAGA